MHRVRSLSRPWWRRSAALAVLLFALTSCTSLSDDEADSLGPGIAPSAAETTSVTTASSTTGSPTTTAPSTTESSPTTGPSTTTESTTTESTTTESTTTESTTTATSDDEEAASGGQSLPRTGPTEAAIFTAVGCAMVLLGRLALDALGLLDRLRYRRFGAGRPLAPR